MAKHDVGFIYRMVFCRVCRIGTHDDAAFAAEQCPGPPPALMDALPVEEPPARAETGMLDAAIRRGFRSPFDPPEKP